MDCSTVPRLYYQASKHAIFHESVQTPSLSNCADPASPGSSEGCFTSWYKEFSSCMMRRNPAKHRS
ncbi:hypothetical protein ASPVEDRAFT_246674 [Aspergillus versicolor CBS 583.65]|uniref:Uncharacterized protein n=1 Tax=Aspergillus versicolor CBS 583.65 TaxID=1036611 RepID=A0A1L9P5B4_ASPVE|nr:uncharacterized protein ASPVEDRAFT_246674 [Aspergillus versicolor CBS 583.65]OJI96613.1 hypothetical protein ASPVEDRAFT_246674 [Aspergillus versicolor CBS 583.65]